MTVQIPAGQTLALDWRHSRSGEIVFPFCRLLGHGDDVVELELLIAAATDAYPIVPLPNK